MADPLGRVEVTGAGPSLVVHIVGDVDGSNVVEIERLLEGALHDVGTDHVVDLTATTYFDSAGIRLLFALATRLRVRRMSLHLVVPPGSIVRRVVDLVDLARWATIHDALGSVPRST